MKKKSNKKVRACAFGIDQLGDIASMVGLTGAGMQGLSAEGSGVDIAGGTLGGLGKGAAAGMAFGPIGGAIGGAVGAIGGALKGVFAKKQIRKQKQREQAAKDMAQAANITSNMNTDYWADNDQSIYTFADGGVLPDLAYLDNNEIVRDVNGNIDQVPNTKPGTDNHLVDASGLESVLSDKLKRPGTKRTFAQEGEKLTRMTKSSKGTDVFAENTNRLNKANANKRYNQLLAEQEEVKAIKGIKPKVKGIPAYEDGKANYGGRGSNLKADWSWAKKLGEQIIDWGKDFVLTPAAGTATNEALGRAYSNTTNRRGLGATKDLQPYTNADVKKYLVPTNGTYKAQKAAGYNRNYGTGSINLDYNVPTLFNSVTPEHAIAPSFSPVDTPQIDVEDHDAPMSNAANVVPKAVQRKAVSTKASNPTPNPKPRIIQADIYPDVYAGEFYRAPNITMPEAPAQKQIRTDPKAAADSTNGGINLGNIAGLMPTMYNMVQGLRGPETESPVLNPYSGSISRSMARRRMNIEPTLAANRRSRAIANYNMANLNANSGMNLAGRTQMAASEYAQNADLYANRDNANNAYLGEYANMMNNLGQQFVQNQTLTNDLNARNRAASRNYLSNAASQIGEWSQIQSQMRNQKRNDDMIYPLLENFLSQGYTSSQIKQIRKAYGSK